MGLAEAEVLARVRALKQKGESRRIGGNFQADKLGWQSTLCAMRVHIQRLFASSMRPFSQGVERASCFFCPRQAVADSAS